MILSVSLTEIMQYSQLFAAIATVGAFVYAIVQVKQAKKHKRAEFIVQLHDMYVHDQEMVDMFYRIEYGEFQYSEAIHMTSEEQVLDKLLGHFNNICRLHEMGVLKDEDIELMRYELCRVANDPQINKYFEWLDYWFKKVGEDEIKFGALRRYAAQSRIK